MAIQGAGGAREVPVLSKDRSEWVLRVHLPLVLAFDHRVNDGADAARFMNSIKDLLEDSAEFLLRV